MLGPALLLLLFTHSFVLGVPDFRSGRSRVRGLGSPGGPADNLPPARWFNQRLDHFNPSESRRWQQRYFENDTFYDYVRGGPVLLMLGGEGPADARWMVTGAWIDYAAALGAMAIQLEHRFYGESQPLSDLSVKNLRYLSSRQALGDAAAFIAANKKYYPGSWVVLGGSYAGSLAAWLRLKYPHLVHAAVSSSAPLRAHLDFSEYFGVVVDSLREVGGDHCVNQVSRAHEQLEALVGGGHTRLVDAAFDVCSPLANATADDITSWWAALADDLADVVQYSGDNRLDAKHSNVTIETVCKLMNHTVPGVEWRGLAALRQVLSSADDDKCMDYSYASGDADLRNDSFTGPAPAGRAWLWQTCTEFGFYQTCGGGEAGEKAMPVCGNQTGLEYYTRQCGDIFGDNYSVKSVIERNVNDTNVEYGSVAAPLWRVVSVHGSLDPWHALGRTQAAEGAPAIYIQGTAHCANMYPARASDLPQLRTARATVLSLLKQWLHR